MSEQDPAPVPAEPTNGRGRLQELRLRRAAPEPGGRDVYEGLRRHTALRLLAAAPELVPPARPKLRAQLDALLFEERIILKRAEKQRLLDDMLIDVYGLGPLHELLADEGVQEIAVHGPDDIAVIRFGRSQAAVRPFYDQYHLAHILARLARQAGEDGRVTLGRGWVAALRPSGGDSALPLLSAQRHLEHDESA